MIKEILEQEMNEAVEGMIVVDLETALKALNKAGSKAEKIKDGEKFNDAIDKIYSSIETEVASMKKKKYS